MARFPKVRQNWVDRTVSYFAPQAGAKRLRARATLALAGGYKGASKSRRQTADWKTSGGDANSDILYDLPTLRERSSDLIRNSALAAGAIHTKVTNVVGTGIKPRSKVDREVLGLSDDQADALNMQLDREFKLFAGSKECHLGRCMAFYETQDLVFRSTLEKGDIFVNLPFLERPGSPYGLKLQFIEAEQVSNPDHKQDRNDLAGGVEYDKHGAPLRYHVQIVHPGNIEGRTRYKWEQRAAFRSDGSPAMLHLYRKLRVNQSRGVPDLAPVMESLKQMEQYTEAEIMAAVVSAMFTVFVEAEGDIGGMGPVGSTGASNKSDIEMGSGAIVDLLPGETVKFADPNRPNTAFDPFVQSILRQVGAALEVPFELLIKHFSASYSASRAALLEAWRFFRGRRTWLVSNYCDPVRNALIAEAVARGRISAPGFFADPMRRAAYLNAMWVGDSPGHIDEVKAVTAAEKRIQLTLSTKEREAAEMNGSDWEDNHKQRAKEHDMDISAGLAGVSAQPADGSGARPDFDDNGNGSDTETGDSEE